MIIEHNTIYMIAAVNGATPAGIRLKYAGTGVQLPQQHHLHDRQRHRRRR